LVGKPGWLYDDTFRIVERSGLQDDVTFTGYVPGSDLPALYSGAMAFVYPSIFEGFGIPPLEAMQCGVPVLTGNRTSLPEVVGDAGVLVDPYDVDAIAAGLETLIFDEDLRTELSGRGLVQARKFSWEETARRTLSVLTKTGAECA
jgi:glycosyltransferase involved in cell wall biosynthesis